MSSDARDLARSLLAKRSNADSAVAGSAPAATPPLPVRPPTRAAGRTGTSLAEHPGVMMAVQRRDLLAAGLAEYGLPNPYYVPHTGVNGAVLGMFGGDYINFSGYNYLGLTGDPRVQAAAKDAIDTYGTSCSASRVVSGQIPLHRALEERIAGAYGVDDAVVTGSGYLTNAAVVSFILGPKDLAVCDALVHNSIVSGTLWGQCQRMNFRHNDPEALDELLRRSRGHFERAMVIVEGVYSMDGDIVVLPEIIEVARRHDCLIMVDEAHSFGVLGDTGFGVSQHYGIPASDVDIWMGTLSKSMSSYGGFLAGNADLCEALRMIAPGISMFAAAPAPPMMGAAIAAFDIMVAEPQRLARLRANGSAVSDGMRAGGVDVGLSAGTPVVPALIGGSRKTMVAAQVLLAAGINANPIMYPAVSEGEGRIRFFVTAEHTPEQIAHTVATLVGHLNQPIDTDRAQTGRLAVDA
jgi:8-amino-7-oxononanoate synthase